MKNSFIKTSLAVLSALSVLFLTGCNKEGYGDFAVTVNTVGPDYVDLYITAPASVEIAYILTKEATLVNPAVLFATGTTMTVTPGQTIRISEDVVQNTQYFLYAVARLDARNYSDIISINFKTKKYNFSETLTVVDTYYDGFKLHVNVPESVRQSGNALRYQTSNIAVYNKVKNLYGTSDLDMLITNGGAHTKFIKNDSTLVYNGDNVFDKDEDGNIIVDESTGEYSQHHDYIAPGEPSVFFVGEFAYGDAEEIGLSGWGSGYFLPAYNFRDNVWSGTYEKVEFTTKKPGKLDAKVKIEIPEDEISAIDAMIYITPEAGVAQYIYAVVDIATYEAMLALLGGNKDYMQWFLTSYLAMYELGVEAKTGNTSLNAASMFVEPLEGNTTYKVICTAMGDMDGTTQNYTETEFTTRKKTHPAPVVEVTALPADRNNPYLATFNVKAPNQDVLGAYYACNYKREWQLALNQNVTYPDLLKGNYTFSAEEINGYTDTLGVYHSGINDPEGLTISFPTLDGETSRMVVYACNDEYTFNNIDPEDPDCKAIADFTAPYAPAQAPVESPLFDALVGEWTATATLNAKEFDEEGDYVTYKLKHSSNVTISASAPAIPDVLPSSVYDLYEKNTKEEVDDMFEDLKNLSEIFTENRMTNHNRLLVTGFVDFDYYDDPGRLDMRTPYDLFIADDYSSVDVAHILYDFGPKWFLQIKADGTVVVPFHSEALPVMHGWPGYPFYVAAYNDETNNAFISTNDTVDGFPVEISDDYNTITIKPIALTDETNTTHNYYMNAMGQNGSSTELVAPVITDIVLTRGWTARTSSVSVDPVPVKANALELDGSPATFPKARTYKSMTRLKAPVKVEYTVDETPNVITMDQLDAALEREIEKQFNIKINE